MTSKTLKIIQHGYLDSQHGNVEKSEVLLNCRGAALVSPPRALEGLRPSVPAVVPSGTDGTLLLCFEKPDKYKIKNRPQLEVAVEVTAEGK